MDRGLAVMVTLVIGVLIAIQPATNNMLSKHTGALAAAFVSLSISTAILATALVVAGDVPRLRGHV